MGKSPQGALVTNLSPNHLDRHGTFEAYARAKRNITLYQKPADFLVLNADDPNLVGWDETAAEVLFFGEGAGTGRKGVFISAGSLVSTVSGTREVVKVRRRWKPRGLHNLLNFAAACAAAGRLGVPIEEAVAAAEDFKPLPHRLEEIGSVSGVRFYNDSIATTPESAVAALESFNEPIVLIAGGYDKGLDLGVFARRAARSVKALVVIGETGGKIAEAASAQNAELGITCPATFDEAVAAAFDEAEPGDVVLLSPACASYDMFGNFQERGEQFRREVERIRRKAGGDSS
ncbi:MAG: UDP-N-acetylmuramoyl-L-alanine--D-glutamate ligase [Planctomycetes bacterium]|nr:UDP-N-acetylmuramoyl-L-alanine--D-glutamate ligase [Planctomycetota bacterium]